MFHALHALAQSATLMIVVNAEGDELRVNITPTQVGDKAPAHKLRPLSLIASPAELEADFAQAVAIWQAPKRSLLEQAGDVGEAEEEDTKEADSASPKTSKTPAAPSAKKSVGRPRKAETAAAAQVTVDVGAAATPGPADSAAAAEAAPIVNTPPAAATALAAGAPDAAEPIAAVDTFTLDLF